MHPDAKLPEQKSDPSNFRAPKGSLMKIAVAISVIFAVVAAGALAFIYSGVYDVSATSPHFDVTYRLMRTVREQSVKRLAQGVKVPELDDPEKVHAGFRNFHAMCVTCHGAPGAEATEISKGLYPEAPNLVDAAKRRTPAELFVIIKRGIKMSGMPAWEPTHSGEEIWALVAFLNQFPAMPPAEYQEAVAYYAKGGKSNEMHH